MMKYAIIENNEIVNIIECESQEIADSIKPENTIAVQSDNASIGLAYEDDIVIPPIDLELLRDNKLSQLESLALEKEEADIDVSGTIISAKREDQFRLTQALSLMGRKNGSIKRFKSKNGWGEVDKAKLEAMQDALESQIDSVTAQHEAHENAIRALTTEQEIIDYDIKAGW